MKILWHTLAVGSKPVSPVRRSARYPGEVETVTKEELKRARHIAREVVAWAENAVRA